MKNVHIIVEGSSEENFVNDVLVKHFAPLDIFVSVRKIRTGWDRINNRPAKGGLLKYSMFRNDVLRWIESDRGRANTCYSSFIDLYAFPKDSQSPYNTQIRQIKNPYERIKALETAISQDINHPNFFPYIQLHEFESLILVSPERFLVMYPEEQTAINRLKKDIGNTPPEEIDDFPQTAPSKRIIKYLPNYEGQKAQVGAMIAEDIGITELRNKCPHFNDWIIQIESLQTHVF